MTLVNGLGFKLQASSSLNFWYFSEVPEPDLQQPEVHDTTACTLHTYGLEQSIDFPNP